MADEDDIAVTLEGEGGGDEVVVNNEDAVAELKRQYQALEADNKKRADAEANALRRAADAERNAAAARNDAAAARTQVVDTQADAISSGLSAAHSEAAAAETDYAARMEAGDFAGAAKAQRRIASAEAKIVRLDEAKADLEARKLAPREEPATRTSSDPIEAYIESRTEPTARWLREHVDWVRDPRKNARLTGAHHFAVAEGYDPDTPEYFEHVEKTLGLRDAPQTRNGSANGQTRTTQRRSAPPVAPVNGSAGAHSSGASDNRSNQVYLTKGEAASATDGTLVWNYDDPSGKGRFKKGEPIGIQEMARRKLAGQKQGLYDKNAIEA